MNSRNYEKVLTEILQCTNLSKNLPDGFNELKPEEKLKTLVSILQPQSTWKKDEL